MSHNTEPTPYVRSDGRCHTRPSPTMLGGNVLLLLTQAQVPDDSQF